MVDVVGKPMAWHVLDRLRHTPGIDVVVLATSTLPVDAPLLEMAQQSGFVAFAGDPEDVLDRLYHAAALVQADVVIEVGGDLPFVDPELVAQGLQLFQAENADYVSNVMPTTFPEGMDVLIISFQALGRIFQNARLSSERLHPLAYVNTHQDEFRIRNFKQDQNMFLLRWTLDYPEDLAFVRAVYERLYQPDKTFHMRDILALLEAEPKLSGLNAGRAASDADSVQEVSGYWHAKAYIADMRRDLADLVKQGTEADAAGNYVVAARCYEDVVRVAQELARRASYLGRVQGDTL